MDAMHFQTQAYSLFIHDTW